MVEEEQVAIMMNPFTFECAPPVLEFLASYGWFLVGASAAAVYALHKLQPRIRMWKEAREDALYHKDPSASLGRLQAVQRARERQQRDAQDASHRALETQKEREEARRQAAAERLQKYGEERGEGRRLGGDEFLPLSAGASTSSYRAPKRSACSRGGCGR